MESERVCHVGEEREEKISRVLTFDSLYWKEGGFEMENKSLKAMTMTLSNVPLVRATFFFFSLMY